MRISDQQVISLTQFQLNNDYEQMAQAQTVLATGRQINTPSDNPIGSAVALELQGNLAQQSQFASTATDTLTWLQTTDASLNGVNNALVQARTLAVQGANGTLSQDERQALAASVDQLLQQAVQSANGSFDGRYVLSGFQTATPPFAVSTVNGSEAVAYQGDNGAMQREISPGQTMQINVPGSTALPAVFSSLIQLKNDLLSGNTAAVGGSDLQGLDQAHDGLLIAQATVGAGMNRIQAVQTTIQGQQTNLTSQLSQLVDANMAQAAVTFSTQQATYQAALAAAAKVNQPSLLEFLK